MARKAHYALVLTDKGPHLRDRGANGKIVMDSQVYASERSAKRTLATLEGLSVGRGPSTVEDERTG